MTIFLTVPEGASLRDFLVLGVVDRLLDLLPEAQLVLLSPAYAAPEFLEICPKERVQVRRMDVFTGVRHLERLVIRRRRLSKRLAIRLSLALEARLYRPPAELLETFREFKPSLVVSTNPMPFHDYQVITTARKLGIQTLGVVRSWDNLIKGLISRPHLLSVWNPVNRDEALSLQGFNTDEVEINGASSFDPHYDSCWSMPREAFLESLGLDPSRPVITYATGGVYDQQYLGRDETHLADDLLRMFADTSELHGAQLIIRLHPTSRLEHFWRLRSRKDVVLSFASYMPTIGWYADRKDILHQVNLLKHSDVIVTPASSWAVESAISDTPVVVPIYSDLQPDHARAQFDPTLVNHFRPLAENNWVPICRSYEETRREILDALTRPGKYASGRKAIVDNYVYYRDANSSQRVVEWIAKNSRAAVKGVIRGV